MGDCDDKIVCTREVPFDIPKIGSYGEYLLKEINKNGIQVLMVNGENEEVLTNQKLVRTTLQNIYVHQKLGLKTGDVICLLSENRLEYFTPILAALSMGIATATVNPSLTENELLHCLNICKPKVIYCSTYSLDSLALILKDCPYIEKLICFESENNLPIQNVYFYNALMEQTENEMLNIRKFQFPKFNLKETLGLILYSSGTTGLPKGVMLTLHNLLFTHLTITLPEYNFDDVCDTTISLLPMYHSFGCIGHLIAFTKQLTTVLMLRFDPEDYFQYIEKYRATLCAVVPPICVLFAKSPLVDNYDLSSLKKVRCGAAPLSTSLENQVCKRLNIDFVRQAYGMTETTLAVTIPMKDSKPPSGSVGIPLIGIKAKVIDVDTGKSLGPNEKGELCFKGDSIMAGYYGNPKATAETIDANGWLHTGDIGYYDRNANFYIVDRMKQLIKVKGFQVAPAEIEAVLLQNPEIKDVGVIGKPDERSGELPIAFVVRQPNSKITAIEVMKFVEERLSAIKHLKGGVRFLNEIPKNPSGKILRTKLKELLKEKSKL